MNQNIEPSEQQEALDLESGFEALRRNPGFRGPVEPLDDHGHSNDHFALIYESQDEQFAAAIPFIRQGLERGEQCLYIADDNSREEVIEAMRDAGIDVDAAIESGALSVHTKQDAYLRNGAFDPDEMIAFLEDAIDHATEEYEALRVTGEMTWVFSDEPDTEDLIEYEAKLNNLLPDLDSIALCQYNRKRFPAEIICDVIRTHPHLIHDNIVSNNVYYTPPEEFFGPERPAREAERMLGTLQERTVAKTALEEREQAQRRLYEIAAGTNWTFDEKLQALFELGQDLFDLEFGGMAKVDVEADLFEVEMMSGEHDHLIPGERYPLSETYCREVREDGEIFSVADPVNKGFEGKLCYDRFGVRSYIGTYLEIDGGADRTFYFLSNELRAEPFSDAEETFHDLMGQWVKYELERRQRERFLRESYAITSDPELSFEEKLERLLNLGREWFDLEMAALSELPSWDGKFRLEKGLGLDVDPEEKPLWTDPGEGCFCRRTITEDTSVSRVDVRGTDWAHDPIYEELGLTSYLGTKVTSGSTPYGTLWFGSTEPREREFSDTEHTFLELIGQWVSYEIERREHQQAQRELYEITADSDLSFEEKVDQLLDLGRDRFDLDMGFFLEKQGDEFGVIKTRGTDLEEGVATLSADTGHYCKQTITVDVPVGVEDTEAAGWDDDPLYREYNLGCYLGTQVTDGSDVFGSVCFADSSARKHEFTDAEYTFLDLLGQWLSYEVEHQQHEADLEETIDQLQQSNDRLKQFAYAASHDLQEPLRMVSSYLQLLENRYSDDIDEQAQDYIDFAVDGAERMRAMVDDLLAFSRVEQADRDFGSVDCNAVLNDVMADLQVQIDETDAEISVETLPTVMADKEQLEQLFSNLVSNAIKYNESDPPRVEITADQQGDHWEVAVTDNGIGIDPEKTDQIFEVFKRLHHDDDYPGTGIGLSLCQEIVGNHGGDLRVESDSKEGSTFFITLPKRRRG